MKFTLPLCSWFKFVWRSKAAELAERQATFHPSNQPQYSEVAAQKRDPWGCMAGTVTILPGTDLTAPSGDTWNAEDGRVLNG